MTFPDTLEALLREATAGDWQYYSDKLRPDFPVRIHEIQDNTGEAIIKWGGFDGTNFPNKRKRADARLIVLLRNHAESLLALVRAADKLVWTPTMIAPPEAQQAFMELRQALRALDGEGNG